MKSLSPWNKVFEKEVEIKGRQNLFYDIIGVSVLDYLDLYQKFTYTNQESYRLDHIANVELGQKKLDHSEFETFKDFYTQDWQKFVTYNIHDVELVDRLEDKMKLIDLAINLAYDAKVNFEDVYYQVRMWDSIIYNYLTPNGIVVPLMNEMTKIQSMLGHTLKNLFQDFMSGWSVLTSTPYTLTSLCSITSRQRRYFQQSIHRQR